MPIIKIFNRDYQIACGPGEETKLLDLASKVNKRLNENAKSFRTANEGLLMVLSSLTLEDQLSDLKYQNAVLQKQLDKALSSATQSIDQTLGETADRIDNICKLLK